MNRVRRTFWNWVQDDTGQDLIEYALIVGLLALAAMAMMSSLAGSIATTLSGIGSKLTASV